MHGNPIFKDSFKRYWDDAIADVKQAFRNH